MLEIQKVRIPSSAALNFLTSSELFACTKVCKQWLKAILSHRQWKEAVRGFFLYERRFGPISFPVRSDLETIVAECKIFFSTGDANRSQIVVCRFPAQSIALFFERSRDSTERKAILKELVVDVPTSSELISRSFSDEWRAEGSFSRWRIPKVFTSCLGAPVDNITKITEVYTLQGKKISHSKEKIPKEIFQFQNAIDF